MSTIDRPLAGALLLDLEEERRAGDPALLAQNGRNARTLVKEGGLRVTLVEVAPGGAIAEHQAAGPITVQVVHGEIAFRVGETEHALRPGVLLSLPAGVRHSLSSRPGGAFLLTLCRADAGSAAGT